MQLNARDAEKRKGGLTLAEIQFGEIALCRMAQQEGYPDERHALDRMQSVDSSSPIYKLLPCVDEAGLMRINGRTVAASFLPEDARKPIIMPEDHFVTLLIVINIICCVIKMKMQ